jgi:hypothetical protein
LTRKSPRLVASRRVGYDRVIGRFSNATCSPLAVSLDRGEETDATASGGTLAETGAGYGRLLEPTRG